MTGPLPSYPWLVRLPELYHLGVPSDQQSRSQAFFLGPGLMQGGSVWRHCYRTGECHTASSVSHRYISLRLRNSDHERENSPLTRKVVEPSSCLWGRNDSVTTQPCKYLSWDSFLSPAGGCLEVSPQAECPDEGGWPTVASERVGGVCCSWWVGGGGGRGWKQLWSVPESCRLPLPQALSCSLLPLALMFPLYLKINF